LIVFAKAPIQGNVKTRMQPHLGLENCLKLHLLLVRLWIDRLLDWDLGSVRKTISFTPFGEDRPGGLDLPPGIDVETQRGRDLGERLSHALHQKWDEGFRRVVFIGTDSPLLDLEDLRAAFQALNQNQVVLGPATDGGYYLIGFSSHLPGLFSGISWGTSLVFKETVQQLERRSIPWHRLREILDLDTYEDLVRFRHSLSQNASVLSEPAGQALRSFIECLAGS
jgi:rSAM/selenodomain-associated transferase 1